MKDNDHNKMTDNDDLQLMLELLIMICQTSQMLVFKLNWRYRKKKLQGKIQHLTVMKTITMRHCMPTL